MATDSEHWHQVWATKAPEDVSWYQSTPSVSLQLLRNAGVGAGSRVIDVGGGASPLAAFLIALDAEVTVADVASEAVHQARVRMGDAAGRVNWLVADVARDALGGPYDVWHDRAVFHFLVDEEDREAYRRQMLQNVPIGGHAVVATFAPDGPETCSGLPVRRYSEEQLAAAFAPEWESIAGQREVHVTPWGAPQPFTYVLLRRV